MKIKNYELLIFYYLFKYYGIEKLHFKLAYKQWYIFWFDTVLL